MFTAQHYLREVNALCLKLNVLTKHKSLSAKCTPPRIITCVDQAWMCKIACIHPRKLDSCTKHSQDLWVTICCTVKKILDRSNSGSPSMMGSREKWFVKLSPPLLGMSDHPATDTAQAVPQNWFWLGSSAPGIPHHRKLWLTLCILPLCFVTYCGCRPRSR